MQHPPRIWQNRRAAETPVDKLIREYLIYLGGKTVPVSPETVKKYKQSLESFARSIEAAGEPMILDSVTPSAGDRWIGQQRKAGLAEETIASRQYAVKTWANAYCHGYLQLTHWDPLQRWPRLHPEPKHKARLTDREIDRVLDCCDRGYVGVRNQAILRLYLSTGIRLRAGWALEEDSIDMISGEVLVREKGNREHLVRLSVPALRALRLYLRERRADDGVTALWTSEAGQPITYNGMQCLFARLKKKSGIDRLGAHLLRRTFAQGAVEKGASRPEVRAMLNHSSDAMAKRYEGEARKKQTALEMPRYAMA